jgi:hypothetical protein
MVRDWNVSHCGQTRGKDIPFYHTFFNFMLEVLANTRKRKRNKWNNHTEGRNKSVFVHVKYPKELKTKLWNK